MQENNPMQYGLFFLLGAVVGATFALLFAPSSGEELRKNIKSQVDTQYSKVQEELQKNMKKMHSAIDQMSGELQATVNEVKERI
jgi:gas vesicle protein